MDKLYDDDGMLDVYCSAPHNSRIEINCQAFPNGYRPNGPEILEEVRNICCLHKPTEYVDSLRCCEALEESGYFNHPQSGWDSGWVCEAYVFSTETALKYSVTPFVCLHSPLVFSKPLLDGANTLSNPNHFMLTGALANRMIGLAKTV